jgi:hypothetical protein
VIQDPEAAADAVGAVFHAGFLAPLFDDDVYQLELIARVLQGVYGNLLIMETRWLEESPREETGGSFRLYRNLKWRTGLLRDWVQHCCA